MEEFFVRPDRFQSKVWPRAAARRVILALLVVALAMVPSAVTSQSPPGKRGSQVVPAQPLKPIAASSSSGGGGGGGGTPCTLTAYIASSPDPSPAKAGDDVTASFSAQPTDPKLKAECALTSKSCSWDVMKIEYRDSSGGSPTDVTSSMIGQVTKSGDGVESPAQIIARNFSAAHWSITVKFTASWTIEKQSGCTDCDCGTCPNAEALLTVAFVVVAVDRIIVEDSDPEVVGSTKVWVGDSVILEAKPKPADATFPDGTPTWTIDSKPTGSTVTASGGASKTLTITPDKPGDYTIKARCGTSVAMFQITAFTLAIKKGGVDVTDQSVTSLVGKWTDLSVDINPDPGIPNRTFQWTIPGTTVKTFTMSRDTGAFTELTADDKQKKTVTLYWIDKLDGEDVSVEATCYGMTKTAKAKFTIQRPTATLTSKTTTAIPAIDFRNDELMFGDRNALNPGIILNGSVTTTAVPTTNAKIAFVQLANYDARKTKPIMQKVKNTTDGNFELDGDVNSVPFYATAEGVGPTETKTISINDSPGCPAGNAFKVSATMEADVYLMYTPGGLNDIWVTLNKVEWDWAGEATKDTAVLSATFGQWTMDYSSYSVDPEGTDSTALPVWTKNSEDSNHWEDDI